MTATDTESALLAAVRANPGEDAPRLVYADALADAGRELDAAMQRIIAQPGEDRWRLDYAAELERTAGTVACGACQGRVWPLVPPPDVIETVNTFGVVTRYAKLGPFKAVMPCSACHGTGRVSDGRAVLAEFIRVQVELQQYNPRDCNQGTCRTGGRDRPCTSCRNHDALRTRERELWPAVRGRFASTDWAASLTIPPSIHDLNMGRRNEPVVLIQRGLPSVVRCTLAEWLGEPCERCQGRGHRTLYGDGSGPWTKCQYCVDGLTPGIGPRLAQRWPIVEVEVVDITDFGFDSDGLWLAANLPSDLTGKIPNHGIFPTDDGRSFADWLSDALLAWARGQEMEGKR